MRRLIPVLVLAMTLAACAHTPPPKPPIVPIDPRINPQGEGITYETGPCFGACPVYRITVSSDGSGTFTGIRNTEVIGERKFRVTLDQYLVFREQFAPYMPDQGERLYQPGSPLCKQVATDLPSVNIAWSRSMRGVKTSRLYFYYGCDMEKNAAMGEALGNATDALPLGQLIGEQP